MRLRLLICAAVLVLQGWSATFVEEYEQCEASVGYGRKAVVCDPQNRLANSTKTKLTNILSSLKERIACECPDGCLREDGTDYFIGLLHVSSSKNTENLKEDMRKEYDHTQLGNSTCDNGLVLVYLKDTQQVQGRFLSSLRRLLMYRLPLKGDSLPKFAQCFNFVKAKLATFRGGDSFILLADDDMQKLHKLAAQGSDSDTLAVQYLLTNYKQVSESPIQSGISQWLPIVGMIVAFLLVLCLVSILLSMLCAQCFCCCAKKKKDIYQVTKPASYKTVEPLYVITPPSTHNTRIGDTIYSTPYSGSPPPPPGTTLPHTPSSTYRYRVASTSKAMSHTGSLGPFEESRINPIYTSQSETPYGTNEFYATGTIPRAKLGPLLPVGANQDDLQFLDPKRRLETQTREELIY